MPNKITETEIQSIISNFSANISEYEIIDMEEYKGWSSEYLYLLVSTEDNFILKAKSAEQITGYDNEVVVSCALIENHIQARRPILTKDGGLFHKQSGYYWCLMTYIPGAASHINEYTDITVKSLAEHIDQYVYASISNENLKNLNLKPSEQTEYQQIFDDLMDSSNYLQNLGILKSKYIYDIHTSIKGGYDDLLNKFAIKSIIHNDINPRNILIDHKSRSVVSLIDWDHVRYGNPLKDVMDAIAIFFDFLPFENAIGFKNVFYQSINTLWFKQNDSKTLEYAFLYFYTLAKWRTILFYLNLLRKYDDTYGERNRFISEIKQNYDKWQNIISLISQ